MSDTIPLNLERERALLALMRDVELAYKDGLFNDEDHERLFMSIYFRTSMCNYNGQIITDNEHNTCWSVQVWDTSKQGDPLVNVGGISKLIAYQLAYYLWIEYMEKQQSLDAHLRTGEKSVRLDN